ncbi:hypothetical protein FVEG_16004 [Fusarium verticillioides 7600]|uniref:Uncharacterized protein n=1 Tax=Gibberella moniliformis (strain M3125 / FGSC 7600) TaxID=334819 RepID=W7MGA9_GIBM7|nr:hypothetical protein FVEG_16004 [Fusarium verticillioides 7600]EWG46654.1 hypothetical protein FVEG_16004 [Fusarium verticillioides 7600]
MTVVLQGSRHLKAGEQWLSSPSLSLPYLQYTCSGTKRARTGTPQPCVHTHRYVLCAALLCCSQSTGNAGLKSEWFVSYLFLPVLASHSISRARTLTGLLELPRRSPDPL